MKRLERDLYLTPGNMHMAFVRRRSGVLSDPPALRWQRVPWSVDARWIVPALVASTAVVVLTLLAWPVAALWRRRRKRRWSEDSGDRRNYLAVRLVLLVDVAVIAAAAALFVMSFVDLTIFDDPLDPLLWCSMRSHGSAFSARS